MAGAGHAGATWFTVMSLTAGSPGFSFTFEMYNKAMFRKVLHSKIHQAVVTEARPDYQGSLTIDANLLDQCGMRAHDAILVANCETGARFETYIFSGDRGSGVIGVNGAAAHLAKPGHRIIIIHWAYLDAKEAESHTPSVLLMNSDNTIREIVHHDLGRV